MAFGARGGLGGLGITTTWEVGIPKKFLGVEHSLIVTVKPPIVTSVIDISLSRGGGGIRTLEEEVEDNTVEVGDTELAKKVPFFERWIRSGASFLEAASGGEGLTVEGRVDVE